MATTPNLSTGASISAPTQRVTRGITQSMLTGSMVQPDTFKPRGSTSLLQFPSDLPKYYFSLGINNYDRENLFKFIVSNSSDIILPLPKQLADNDSVQYEQKELSSIGAAGLSLAEGAVEGNPMGGIYNAMGALISGGLARANDAIKNVIGADLGAAAQAFSGAAPNQFTTVLLKGPGYKKHEFSWTLSPRNANESRVIKEIIRKLKNSMFVGKGPGIFTAPKIFTPKFFFNESYLYKFKPCVLENMSVNYSPSGAPAFYSSTGAPDAVEIRLSFLEVEFWFADEY